MAHLEDRNGKIVLRSDVDSDLLKVGDGMLEPGSDTGDLIFKTGGVERSRITSAGAVSGLFSSPLVRNRWKAPNDGATFITQFASGHGWTATVGAGGAVDLNDTITPGPFAAQSVKMTSNPATTSYIDKTGLSIDLTGKSVLLWVKYANLSAGANMTFYMGDASFTNYYVTTFSPPAITDSSGWFCHEFAWERMSATGAPNPAAIAHMRLRVESNEDSAVVSVGGVATRPSSSVYPNGVVTFTFDDSALSNYTLARPTLSAYGFTATCFLIADAVGSSGPSVAQYRQMQDTLGWEIAGHAYTTAAHNTRYENLSASALEIELGSLKRWLVDNGFVSDSWASPGGTATTDVWTAASRYFNCHRNAGVISPLTNFGYRQSIPVAAPYRILAATWDSSLGVAAFNTEIDHAKARAMWLVLNFHAVTSAASSGPAISQSDLDSIASHAQGAGIAVRTVDQVLREAGMVGV